MAATSIYFNGRVISVPGSYSQVDASGLETVGLGASGVVAVLGTAEGGVPVSAISEFSEIPSFNSPEKVQRGFRSGQLRDVGDMLFAPAKDADILAGAQTVLMLKTNPATQSTGQLKAGSVPQIDLASKDYGAFTAQINVALQDGTSKGRHLTIRFEDLVETVDDLGGDTLAGLQYSGGSNGLTTAVMGVNAAGDITVTGTKAVTGLSTDLSAAIPAGKVEVVSSSVGDTTQSLTVYGKVGGVATTEVLHLNGTSAVLGTTTWDVNGIFGVVLSAAAAGTVTLQVHDGGTALVVLAPAALSKGMTACEYCYVDGTTLSTVLDNAGAVTIGLWGRNAAGGAVSEVITTNGTTPVVTSASTWAQVDLIGLGNLPTARTFTATFRAARSLASVQTTMLKAADYFTAKSEVISGPTTRGFIWTWGDGRTSGSVTRLDQQSNVNVKSPATGSLTADLYAMIDWINQNSQIVEATRSGGATMLPDNTSSPLFLSGGTEGIALFSHYQTALNLLKRGRVNSIVDLSGDPAVAAALDAHCAYMGGIGRSERDGFIGLLNAGMDDVPSKTEIKQQIVDVNSRHIRAWGQAISRYNSAGEKTEYLPPFGGAILAGMQAGSPVGTSLTFKYMNLLGLRQHSSWNPTDDAEEMIQAGLVFGQNVDGIGRRVVRNITTHLSSSNIAFTEGSVNCAVNFAVFNFRTNLEFAVGKRGFSGTLAATRGVAVGTLGLLVDNVVITAYRSLFIELIVDVMDVSVEMAPIIPINFVRTTVHLVTLAQTA